MNRINFRTFNAILGFEWETRAASVIAFVIDQSHNVKGKIEATLQELYAKASLADRGELASRQTQSNGLSDELLLQDAFGADVRRAIELWRTAKGVPRHPVTAFRESGYLERITRERPVRPTVPGWSHA